MNVTQSKTGVVTGSAARAMTSPPEFLSELGRATTAYYDATPDRMEQARQEYEEALRRFNASSGYDLL